MPRSLVAVTGTCALLILGACSSNLLGPDFETQFAHQGGCGDVFFFAVDGEDEVLMTFNTSGLVATATEVGDTTTTTFDLPDAEATLIVEVGSRISDAICDDVIENGGPRVDRTYRAMGGTATVTIRPSEDIYFARGDLVLEDVVLRDNDGHTVRLERLEWTDTGVGWLPG
jgi:hypothetical protein